MSKGGKGASIYNCNTWLVGMQNATTTWEDSMAVSYQVKQALTICSSNTTLRYFPK